MDTAEPVLVVAAERRELANFPGMVGERLDWPLDYAARLGGWILVANGAGPVRAAEAVEVALARIQVRAVVSTGYCGALDASLQVADLVVATRVNGHEACLPVSNRRRTAGAVISTDRVVQTIGEKRKLRETGAVAIEMEAAGVAERARPAGLPFYCVRAVTDRADETLSIDFNAARDRDGRIGAARVVRQALAKPWSGLPELVRLANRSRQASRALGDFFADCRIG